jgi:hypothetical protein
LVDIEEIKNDIVRWERGILDIKAEVAANKQKLIDLHPSGEASPQVMMSIGALQMIELDLDDVFRGMMMGRTKGIV